MGGSGVGLTMVELLEWWSRQMSLLNERWRL